MHAYSDVDDDDFAGRRRGDRRPPFIDRPATAFSPAGGGCLAAKPCTWNHNTGGSWNTNRRQNAVQAFYFANRFHDYLAAAPISFGAASGSFDAGSDPLELQTDDGADRPAAPGHRPHQQREHVHAARRQRRRSCRCTCGGRRASGRSTAATTPSIVYHEYTHGLSNRLVTDAGGRGALNSPQAGAMGEGWSDWYAKDFLVSQFPGARHRGRPGDVDMGAYVDATPHSLRSQGLDCPVGASPASARAPARGLGRLHVRRLRQDRAARQEVHADGEIWAETLWDLRARGRLGRRARG